MSKSKENQTREFGKYYSSHFAERLREQMRLKGKKQADIITIEGTEEKWTTRQTISNYMNGDTLPTSEAIVNIANIFGVSSDYLLGLTDDEVPIRTEEQQALRTACDYTGLNANVISRFHNRFSLDYQLDESLKSLYDAKLNRRQLTEVKEEIKEEIESDIEEAKQMYNEILSSDFIENTLSCEASLSSLNEKMSLYLAVLFEDDLYLKNANIVKDEKEDNKIFSVIEYLEDDLTEKVNSLQDDYFLQLFKCQQAMSKYIQGKYSTLDYFANYNEEFNNIQSKLTLNILFVIDEALKSDNVLETLHKGIKKIKQENIFNISEMEFFKKIFYEVKNNE